MQREVVVFSLNMRYHFALHSIHMVTIVRLYGETTYNIISLEERTERK